jgi:transposase-like protein
MAHRKQDSTLIEIFQASSGNGNDSLKTLLRHMIQQVLEEEMTAFLNAELYSRTDGHRGYRKWVMIPIFQ